MLSPLTPGKIRRQQNDGAQVIDVRPGGIGASILNHGTMMIAGSRITGNTAPNDSHGSPGIGGGIGNVPSQGGVPGTGVLTVRNSVLSGNSASGFGGGLGNAPGAKATVIGSTVSGNSAATGGGLASQGRLVMKGSLVTRNTASAAGGIAKARRHGHTAGHHGHPQRTRQLRTSRYHPRLHRLTTHRRHTEAAVAAGCGRVWAVKPGPAHSRPHVGAARDDHARRRAGRPRPATGHRVGVCPADYHRSVAMTRGPADRAGPGAAVPAPDTCCGDRAPATAANPDARWLRDARCARWLAWASLAWMAAEGAVGLAAGVAAGSIALVGWALGSGIEALASVIVVWRFTGLRMMSETAELRAHRAVAVSFWLLAPCITAAAIRDLAAHHPASPTLLGIALTASSLVIMPVLGIAKRRLGARLGSGATAGEGTQNLMCAAQAAGVLLALVVVAAWPSAWPVDPIIALGIAAWSAWEGHRSWRGADCC